MHLSRAASAFVMLMAAVSPHAADADLVARPDEFAIKLYHPEENNRRSRDLHVLDNDSGLPPLIITQAVALNPSKGVCSVQTNNEGEDVIVWTRNEDNLYFVGNTTCLYTVCDGQNVCVENVPVLLKIQPVIAWNDPEAVSGPPIFVEPNQVTRSYNVVENDDPKDEPLLVTSVVVVSGPGTCAISSDDVRFVVFRRATLDFRASTTVCSYQVCSASGTVYCDSAEVTFTAKALQQTPQFLYTNNDKYILPNNQPSSPAGDIQVLLNDYSNRPIRLNQIVSGPADGAGTCTVVSDTLIRYTRPARSNFEGEAYCDYSVCTVPRDGEARLCQTALLTIVVGKPNSRVIPVNDVFVVNPDEGLSPVLPVLANDGTNPPGRPLEVVAIGETQPEFGECIISGARTGIRYRHNVNVVDFPNSVDCDYTACTTDTFATACASATVTIVLRTGPTPRPTRNPTRKPTRKPVTKNPGTCCIA
jgi:hypothetical protein